MLVMVDTLRADYLGTYGMEGASPEIDKFSNDAVVFEQAIAQASWTRASTATLFSSMQPSRHSTDVKVSVLPDEIETVAEVLQAHGYNTGGLPNNINVTRSFNFQQGFDYFSYQAPEYLFGATESASQLSMYNVVRKLKERVAGAAKRVEDFYQPANTVLGNAQGFIEANRDANWFLFVHLMEPHDPYFEYPLNGKGYGRAEHEHPDPENKDYLIETYKGEIREMDDELGQFFEWMKTEGLYDNTVILITSDHGEEFYEHGGWWHGTTLYDEQIRVPMIVKLPNQAHAGTRVPWQVRHLDVAPTLTSQAGEPTRQLARRRLLRRTLQHIGHSSSRAG
jgi:arylsulfatase A-like enzyme